MIDNKKEKDFILTDEMMNDCPLVDLVIEQRYNPDIRDVLGKDEDDITKEEWDKWVKWSSENRGDYVISDVYGSDYDLSDHIKEEYDRKVRIELEEMGEEEGG